MKKLPNYRIFSMDPWLLPYREKLQTRLEEVKKRRAAMLNGQDIADFANGYMYYGLNRSETGWTLREWLPHADSVYLIGDFNGWNRESHPLTSVKGGEWEIKLPQDALKPGQRYLLQVRSGEKQLDRVSAWARQVEQSRDNYLFSAVVPREDYVWKHTLSPRKTPDPLLIYEAHIGMAQEKGGFGTYEAFTREALPRIRRAGYNAVQLMAVQSHAYYASFGYQVTNPFAPACWFGEPEGLKQLIDEAHGMGLRVLLDVVHSHTADNGRDGISDMDGSGEGYCKGYHPAWGSRLYDYGRPQVCHYLLSNLKYWMDEYHFDGFRFDGVGSMLYTHHGLNMIFSGYDSYFDGSVNTDAVTYLTMAAELTKRIHDQAITIAEDMSGYPGLCLPLAWGGVGMKYRLNMGVPDYWIKLVQDRRDESWSMGDIWYELTRRRPMEKRIGYTESHDQALVGDKTLLFRMLDAEMYTGMDNEYHSPTVDRGIALIKMLKLITCSLAGEGYLNFMGNEFGHPEWIDFPREGNGWSTQYARRQWSLADNGYLKYSALGRFDRDMLGIMKKYKIPGRRDEKNLWFDEENKLLIYEKGGLIFAFNFHPWKCLENFRLPGMGEGKWRRILDTDARQYAGFRDEEDTVLPDLTITLSPRTAAILARCD